MAYEAFSDMGPVMDSNINNIPYTSKITNILVLRS